jgi:hypothetical protein
MYTVIISDGETKRVEINDGEKKVVGEQGGGGEKGAGIGRQG